MAKRATEPRSKNSEQAYWQSLKKRLCEATTQDEIDAIKRELNPNPRSLKNQGPTTEDLAYERKKVYVAERERQKSRKSRDVAWSCPECVSTKIRDKIKEDLKFALETLWPHRFQLAWSHDHLDMINDIKDTILSGGQLARAMPRGTGKTSILICAIVWAILCGRHTFAVLIGATGSAAEELLEQIRTEFETNDRLYAYFPELVHPIRKLEGIRQRRLLWDGEPIVQEWKKKRIILPNHPRGPGAGAIIAVAGLLGRIRGMNYQRTDGTNVRPSIVLIDDPQTKQSASSRKQNVSRELTLCGDVLGLAGPGKRIAVLMACTVIQSNDVADRMLDRKLHPEWHGKRTRLLTKLPDNLELWEEYAEILRTDLRSDLGMKRANAFYKKRRRLMDAGALAAWPQRYAEDELSAVQHAMNIRILNREAFEAEYQNQPLVQVADDEILITADEIVTRCNALERGRVPLKAEHITGTIDVQGKLLYWGACWWCKDFTGGILDVGAWPDQGKNYFTLDEANPTIIEATGRKAKMAGVRAALDKLINQLMSRKFIRDDGVSMQIDKLCVDANWGESTDTVFDACRESVYAQQLRPCHGKGMTVTSKPMAQWKAGEGETNGDHWFRRAGKRGLRYLTTDVNYWKTFVHNGLNLMPEERHSISLFKAQPHQHRMLADHLTSETRQRPKAPDGRTVDIWSPKPGTENHLFDVIVHCAVGASELGVKLTDEVKQKRPARTKPIEATYF